MKKLNVLMALMAFAIVFSSCEKLIGKGPVVTETRSTTTHNSLEIAVPASTFFTQDTVYKLQIAAQQNILDEIETVVINNELKVRFRHHHTNVKSSEGITIHVSAPDIRDIKMEGSGNLVVSGPFTPANIRLAIEGSGNIEVQDVSTTKMSTQINGSGRIVVKNGIANEAEPKIEGSGHIDISGAEVKDVNARISGSGTIRVFSTHNLDARIDGSGTIFYKGAPQLNTHVSGSGSVVHM